MFDPRVLEAADLLRDVFGPMICNTWFSPRLIAKYGRHRFRGLRATNQKIGASRSAHKLGINKASLYSAIDLVPVKLSAVAVRNMIKTDIPFWKQYISRMEVNISWLHFDSRPHKYGGIRFFKPLQTSHFHFGPSFIA